MEIVTLETKYFLLGMISGLLSTALLIFISYEVGEYMSVDKFCRHICSYYYNAEYRVLGKENNCYCERENYHIKIDL